MSVSFLVSAGVHPSSIDDPPPQLLRRPTTPARRSGSPVFPEVELEEPGPLSWAIYQRQTPPPRKASRQSPNAIDLPSVVEVDLSASAAFQVWAWGGDQRRPSRRRQAQPRPEAVGEIQVVAMDPASGGLVWIDAFSPDGWRAFQAARPGRAEAVQLDDQAPEYLYLPSPPDVPHFEFPSRPPTNISMHVEPLQDLEILTSWHGVFQPGYPPPKPGRATFDFPPEFWEQAPEQLWFYSQPQECPQRRGRGTDAASAAAAAQQSAAGATANPGSFEQSLAESHEMAWHDAVMPPWLRQPRKPMDRNAPGAVAVLPASTFTIDGPYTVVIGQVSWLGAVTGEITVQ